MMHRLSILALSLGLLLAWAPACGDDGGSPGDAGDTLLVEDSAAADTDDTGQPHDSTTGDSSPGDSVPGDSSPGDSGLGDSSPADVVPDTSGDAEAGLPLAGFGAISGTCDVLDDELTAPGPFFFVNHIDFGSDGYDDSDYARLTSGGQEIIDDGNAGGNSIMSEVFAFELLARCELATLLKTETEIVYDVQGKITDLLVEVDDLKIGVSVTRAVGYPKDDPYTVAQASALLHKKLSGIIMSSENVSDGDAWTKQILHVLAYDAPHMESLQTAWDALDTDVKVDTIVIVTVSDGDDAFIY